MAEPDPFTCDVQRHGDTCRVLLAGEVDVNVAAAVHQAVLDAVGARPPGGVEVDLTRLSFLDSRGLSALIAGRKAADASGCRYRVLGAQGVVLRTLQVTAVLPFLNGDLDGGAVDGEYPRPASTG